jgi:hypothetical protein
MSDRTFRLILDGKKGGLVKGTTPASAAKKACKKLSAETGKSSIKFELQETTKDSKKKVYGPYKINVKMAGGAPGQTNSKLGSNMRSYYIVSNEHALFPKSSQNTHYGLSTATSVLNKKKTNNGRSKREQEIAEKDMKLSRQFERDNKRYMQKNPNIPIAHKSNKRLIYNNSEKQLIIASNGVSPPINIDITAREMAKRRIIANKGQNFYENPEHLEYVKKVTAKIAKRLANNLPINSHILNNESNLAIGPRDSRYNRRIYIKELFENLYSNPPKNLKNFKSTKKQLKNLLEEYSYTQPLNYENYNNLEKKYNKYLRHSEKFFEDLYTKPASLENLQKYSRRREKLEKLLKQYRKSNASKENIKKLEQKFNKYLFNTSAKIRKPNQILFNRFMENVGTGKHNPQVYKLLDSELQTPTHANILKSSPKQTQYYPQNNNKTPLILQKPQNKQNESLTAQPLSNKEKNKQKKLERKAARNAKFLPFINNS